MSSSRSSLPREGILHAEGASEGCSKIGLQSIHRISPGCDDRTNGSRQTRKPRKTKKFTPPPPYTGPRHTDGRLLHCYYCDVSKRFKSRLVDHMAFHFPPEHDCPKCGKAFHTAHSRKKHMVAHSENPYKCQLCEFTTKYSQSIRNHIAWHRKKTMSTLQADAKPNIPRTVPIEALPNECVNDQNKVALDGHLNLTNKTKWEIKAKATKKLPPPYPGPRQLSDGYFHCYYCPEAFKVRSKLESHMYRHLPPQYFCKLCGFGFSKSTYYRRHKQRAHSSEKTFKCRLCDFRAKWDSTLVAHVRKIHGKASRNTSRKPSFVSCYHCGWSADYKSRLIPHMKRHLQRGSGCRIRQLPKNRKQQLRVNRKEIPERESSASSVGQLPLDCSLCNYRAKSRPTLRKHISMKHAGDRELFKCQSCSFQTKYRHSLRLHVMRHTNDRPHACPHCDYRAIHKAKLKAHLERHSGKSLHECHLCKFRCATASSLNSHLLCHGDVKRFTCPRCPFATFQIRSFAVHLKKHVDAESTEVTYIDAETAVVTQPIDEKPHLCQLCNHPAETIILLYEHVKSHGRERHFKCPHCPYATFNHSVLNEHVNARHTKEVLFKCEFCNFKTAYKNSLKGHTNSVHTRSQWFKCRFCDFEALQKRTVVNHERTHTGDKRYECDLCGYRSITSGRLKEHKLTHTGERPFACDLCEFRAPLKKHIQRHMQGVHCSERPFKCTFCSESFKTKQTAKLHELCHTGKKVYQCPKCAYDTVLERCLRNHMVEMHPVGRNRKKLRATYSSGRKILWYRCDECAFTVTCKPSLVRHMKLRHPQNS